MWSQQKTLDTLWRKVFDGINNILRIQNHLLDEHLRISEVFKKKDGKIFFNEITRQMNSKIRYVLRANKTSQENLTALCLSKILKY